MTDLSFSELRKSNLMESHENDPMHASYVMPMRAMLTKLDDKTLAQALAELIIQADWMAAERGIDIVLAIRNRFAEGPPPMPETGSLKLDEFMAVQASVI